MRTGTVLRSFLKLAISYKLNNRKINVAVLVGGPSAEHDVSLETGRVILNALDKNKYNPIPVTITKDKKWLLSSAEKSLVGLKAGEAIIQSAINKK